MNSAGKLLIVDSNPLQLTQVTQALSEENITILSASKWEDAMAMVTAECISGVVVGIGTDENECLVFAEKLKLSKKNSNAPVYFLTDHEPATTSPLSNVSAISQYVISRTSDLHHLKEAIKRVNIAYRAEENFQEAEQLLGDVIETLEVYTGEIHDSIRYASYIQKALLPAENALDRVMSDYFVINKPKDVVSGDFYWYTVKYNRVIIAVADCTGHGVPGALLSMIGNNLLNSIVNEKNITNPALILKQMNQNLQAMFEKAGEYNMIKDGMDMAVISIDPDQRLLEFSGARRPLVGFVNGELLKLKGNLHSIGCSAPISAEFDLHRVSYGLKDIFYLGSDGYCDQFGGQSEKKLGTKKFLEILSGLQHLKMTEQKSFLNLFHNNWKKNLVQTDDVLVMGFRPSSIH